MNYRKLRFVENLIILMFPVSVLVACTTNGTDSATDRLATAEETLSIVQEESPIFYVEEQDLLFGKDLIKNIHTSENVSWVTEESADNQYIIVSPSTHLAVYKTTNTVNDVMQESVQTAHLKESNALIYPGKSVFHFDSDNYNITEEDIKTLEEHANFLLNNPQFNLTVSGHTDHTGSLEYNQKLSEQRAQLIMDILITYGAPAAQVIADGYGETVPLNSEENLAENRRVELEYSRALMVSGM